MTTYNFSALTNGQSIAFNPFGDVLNFDQSFISAASFRLFNVTNGALASVSFGGKTVNLSTPVDVRQLTTGNVTFLNGSQLLVGDNTTGITLDNGPNSLTGTALADLLAGLGGNDSLSGGAGNDHFVLNGLNNSDGGNDTVDGGTGFDQVDYGGNGSAINANLETGLVTKTGGTIDHLVSIESVIGSDFADILTGGNPVFTITGSLNDPVEEFEGRGGNDTIDGGSTDDGFFTFASYRYSTAGINVDLAHGTAQDGLGGTDTLRNIDAVRGSDFADVLTGGSHSRSITGTDFESFEGFGGNDTISGGGGFNRADYANSPGAVTVNLATGIASDGYGGTDTLIDINVVRGSAFGDSLIGGNPLNDTLEIFDGGPGNDIINGGSGSDRVDYNRSTSAATVRLDLGTAQDGVGGSDTLISIERVRGTDFDDTIIGNQFNNVLAGGLGNDTLDGGDGIDWADYAFNLAVVVDLAITTAQNTGGAGIDTLSNFENLSGSSFADVLYGTSGDNRIDGRGGADTMDGRGGNDTYVVDNFGDVIIELNGGGTDAVETTLSLYTLGAFVENLTYVALGVQAANPLFNSVGGFVGTGNALDNSITGGSGADSLTGGDGNDSLSGGLGMDTLIGGIGNDTLRGGDQADTLTGGDGDDSLSGGRGNDSISGGEGNDTLAGMVGNDGLDGGNGIDTADYSTAGDGVNVSLAIGTGQFVSAHNGTDTLTSIENLVGGGFNDNLVGDGGANTLSGLDGNDQLEGGLGNDILDGGAGLDRVVYVHATNSVTVNLALGTATGADGSDTLISIERVQGSAFADTLTGGNPDNIYVGKTTDPNETFEGMGGNDSIDGGSSAVDVLAIVTYLHSTAAVNVNLGSGIASDGLGGTDSLANIDIVTGSNYNDVLVGGSNSAQVIVNGLFEQFEGGLGDDTIDGGGDGEGSDRVSYQNATGSVTVNLALGTATGADGNDTLRHIDQVRASNYNDTIIGDGFNNAIEGLAGDDLIDGGAGFDTLRFQRSTAAATVTLTGVGVGTASDGLGGTDTFSNIEFIEGSDYNDTMTGAGGNDWFQGLAGNDSINGGTGFDRVSYSLARGGVGVSVNLAGGTATDSYGGTDILVSIEGAQGSQFADTLLGDGVANALDGLAGNDTLRGFAGNDTLNGGLGTDDAVFSGNMAAYTVTALGNKSYTVAGTDGSDTVTNIERLVFDDQVQLLGTGTTYVWSATGPGSILVFDASQDIVLVDGGFSAANFGVNDTRTGVNAGREVFLEQHDANSGAILKSVPLWMSASSDLTNPYKLYSGNLVFANGSLFMVGDNTTGTSDDTTTATLNGGAGDDFLITVGGSQTLNGGDGNDRLLTAGGGAGQVGGSGTDVLNGGNGIDWLDLGGVQGSTGYTVNLALGTGSVNGSFPSSFTLSGIENVAGNDFADNITGDSGNNVLNGEDGNDTLTGADGNDTLIGGSGNDSLDGGNGSDFASYSNSSDGVAVNLTLATQFVSTNSGTDTLVGIENLVGSQFNDNFFGTTGANIFIGGAGNDIINGDYGNDTIDGGDGNDNLLGGFNADSITGGAGNDTLGGGNGFDSLSGGDGNDSITGGLGTDTVTGGLGADRFNFRSALDGILNIDLVTDFTSGTDLIELSAGIFTAYAGQVGQTVGLSANLLYDAGSGALSYDSDGAGANAAVVFAILGSGAHPAVGNDFIIAV